jgi:4-hydroxy-tetrahydrodipicolinate synthase
MQYQSIQQPINMKITKKYHGVVVPLITPFTADYRLDSAAVEKIFANMYANEASPFILGTTGEASSICNAMKFEYLKLASQNKKAGTLLYAGISSNCLEESIDFAKLCFDYKVDAVAATLPSYYLLTESQIKKYFETLADAINGPLIIYNIPSTTHMSIPLEIIEELSYHPNIVGTKDSERGESRLNESISLWAKRSDFSHFLGWAAKSAHALLNGSDGLIPSSGNINPGLYHDMKLAVHESSQEQVYEYQHQSDLLGDLYQSGHTLGESLWALKVLMEERGFCSSTVMPPLQPMCKETERRLKISLHKLIERKEIHFNATL